MRLDQFLVQSGHYESREKAVRAIQNGFVNINGKIATKASQLISNPNIHIECKPLKYVSKGGEKMEKALRFFNISPQNNSVLDLGSSTGGFADCMLQHGASSVTCIDIGTNQLHHSLRSNLKIKLLEQTDARDINIRALEQFPFDWVTADLSFTSVKPFLPIIYEALKTGGKAIVLIKPQFENDKRIRFRGGIVKDTKIKMAAIKKVSDNALKSGLKLIQTISTDYDEGKNEEFLAFFTKD